MPAGTIEPGESAAAAAIREVQEETGITATDPVLLTTATTALHEGQRAMLEPTDLRAGPGPDAERLGVTLRRGLPCRVAAIIDGSAEIVFEEMTNANPPKVIRRFSGWVPQAALAGSLERSFFYMQTPREADQWSWFAEDRHWFECYWVPLVPKPVLVEAQQLWVDDCYERLLELADLKISQGH